MSGRTMIEKVEVGLENTVFNPHAHGCSVQIHGDPRQFYAALARAALTAMREPTSKMGYSDLRVETRPNGLSSKSDLSVERHHG